jgi:protein-L-isoaspartate(D-aspartate) O-methyltransferase
MLRLIASLILTLEFFLMPTGGIYAEVDDSDSFAAARARLVDEIREQGIRDEKLLGIIGRIPRHLFVPERFRSLAYNNHPVLIGEGQTISQPFIVAYMTEALKLDSNDRVLEIGTGSGYQAAILGELAKEVYSVEIVESLGKKADRLLKKLHYKNVHVRIGDGFYGWPEMAPFSKIILTAAPAEIPTALTEQLAEGGTLIAPRGEAWQNLILIKKEKGKLIERDLLPVSFVPFTGESQKH